MVVEDKANPCPCVTGLQTSKSKAKEEVSHTVLLHIH